MIALSVPQGSPVRGPCGIRFHETHNSKVDCPEQCRSNVEYNQLPPLAPHRHCAEVVAVQLSTKQSCPAQDKDKNYSQYKFHFFAIFSSLLHLFHLVLVRLFYIESHYSYRLYIIFYSKGFCMRYNAAKCLCLRFPPITLLSYFTPQILYCVLSPTIQKIRFRLWHNWESVFYDVLHLLSYTFLVIVLYIFQEHP